jgi:hypothetical protein
MKLVRVRRSDGTSYLAEVLDNPSTTHTHDHQHTMFIGGGRMQRFSHSHGHTHMTGSIQFHAHKHTPEELKKIHRVKSFMTTRGKHLRAGAKTNQGDWYEAGFEKEWPKPKPNKQKCPKCGFELHLQCAQEDTLHDECTKFRKVCAKCGWRGRVLP